MTSNSKKNPQEHGSMTVGEGDHIYPVIRQRGGMRHIPSLNCPCEPTVEPSVVAGEGHAIHNDEHDPAFPLPARVRRGARVSRASLHKRQLVTIAQAAGALKNTVPTSTPTTSSPKRARLIKRK